MKMFKGFDKNLKCRDYQYQIGRTEKENSAKLCNRGFHACAYPMDVFGYYPPADSRYCEVDMNGVTDETGDDSKRCGTEIKVLAEIGIAGIAKASVDFIMRNVKDEKRGTNTGDYSAATNTGNYSAATNTGNRSAATNTGDYSAATNTGDQSAATNTGNYSAATNTGDYSAAAVEGKESVAISLGIKGKAKGAVGCWLVLAQWENVNFEWHRVGVKSFYVDGEEVKADTFYTINGDGKLVEVEE